MAAITQTSGVKDGGVPVAVTRTVLSASDTLTYNSGTGQVLVLFNTTASIVNVTIAGSAAPATIPVAGIGGTFSLAGGKVLAVPASGTLVVDLDDLFQYLQGNITLTNGTGVTAHLFT
jgi:hypothetical protein